MDLPDKSSSVIGPEIFNFLTFHLLDIYGDVIYRTLCYSLLSCPRLESYAFSYVYPYASVEPSLVYKHVENPTSSGPTNKAINFLQICTTSPAKYYFDLVTTHFHDIETVLLDVLDWNRSENDSVIDLTGFKKLKTFNCTSFIYYFSKMNDDQENGFVLLKYTNREEDYYYLDEKKRKNSQVSNDIVSFLAFLHIEKGYISWSTFFCKYPNKKNVSFLSFFLLYLLT